MIIPISEILNNENHYFFKSETSHSLEYQLEKVVFFCKKVEKLLDEHNETEYFYITNKEFPYHLETLISNFSTLIEYYYSWVIFSFIGTIKHTKANYTPTKNREADINKLIKEEFKKHSIGTLEKETIKNYKDLCKKVFLDAISFLFIGKFHEIYVINNYLKHNRILGSYAPKVAINNKTESIPYIYINKPNDILLNESILRCFLKYDLDENSKIAEKTNDYYVDIFNTHIKLIGNLGGLKLFNINGIEYVVGKNSAGISIESILDISLLLCSKIIEKFSESEKNNITITEKLKSLMQKVTQRKPKTIDFLLDTDKISAQGRQ